MDWISDLLRLNTHIVAVQAVVSAQAITIGEMIEAGEDTANVEALHRTSQNVLRRLRASRDTLLDEIKDGV
jgi:hypothetical protein